MLASRIAADPGGFPWVSWEFFSLPPWPPFFSPGRGCLLWSIYPGQIAHKGQLYPGRHPALIDDATWTAVRNRKKRSPAGSRSNDAPQELLNDRSISRGEAVRGNGSPTSTAYSIDDAWSGPHLRHACVPNMRSIASRNGRSISAGNTKRWEEALGHARDCKSVSAATSAAKLRRPARAKDHRIACLVGWRGTARHPGCSVVRRSLSAPRHRRCAIVARLRGDAHIA